MESTETPSLAADDDTVDSLVDVFLLPDPIVFDERILEATCNNGVTPLPQPITTIVVETGFSETFVPQNTLPSA